MHGRKSSGGSTGCAADQGTQPHLLHVTKPLSTTGADGTGPKPLSHQQAYVASVIRGRCNYYGIMGNSGRLSAFRYAGDAHLAGSGCHDPATSGEAACHGPKWRQFSNSTRCSTTPPPADANGSQLERHAAGVSPTRVCGNVRTYRSVGGLGLGNDPAYPASARIPLGEGTGKERRSQRDAIETVARRARQRSFELAPGKGAADAHMVNECTMACDNVRREPYTDGQRSSAQ